MKIFYFLLLSLLLINLTVGFNEKFDSSDRTSRGLTSYLCETIANVRSQLKHGFPEYGIPPLAPFKQKNEKVIDYEHKFLSLHAIVNNLTIIGVDNFDIVKCDVSFWRRKIIANFKFHSVHIEKGFYKLKALTSEDLGIIIQGNGSLDYEVKDIEVNTEFTIGVGWKGLKIKNYNTVVDIESCKSNITGLISGGLTTEIINRVIEQLTVNIIKDHKMDLSKIIHDLVVPYANSFLSGITLKDIFKWIFGY